VWSSAWRCDLHGEIDPLAPAKLPTMEGLQVLVRQAKIPVWLPWPLPSGWLVSGFTGAGDERTGTRGSAVALSGPNPLGGPAEMLIIAEEPGVGLADLGAEAAAEEVGEPHGEAEDEAGEGEHQADPFSVRWRSLR